MKKSSTTIIRLLAQIAVKPGLRLISDHEFTSVKQLRAQFSVYVLNTHRWGAGTWCYRIRGSQSCSMCLCSRASA